MSMIIIKSNQIKSIRRCSFSSTLPLSSGREKVKVPLALVLVPNRLHLQGPLLIPKVREALAAVSFSFLNCQFCQFTKVKFMAICFSCVKSALFNSLMEVLMSTDNFHSNSYSGHFDFTFAFLMHSRISIRGCVRRSVHPSICRSIRPSVRPSVSNELKSRKWAISSKVRVKDGIENECMTNQATVKSPGTIISAITSMNTSKIPAEVPA